ncbi:MAG: hypothetical protein FJ128_12685 [Deltaproteobacteria bacterium]|nr:hypothetical protein [Deltaproteobacteria bacterium]
MKKRRLLNDRSLNPDLCRKYGEQFLAHGWWEDALEYFLKADYQPGLEQLLAHCLEEGDAYLLGRLGNQDPEIWRQVAVQAEQLGKLHFAAKAWQEAGDQDRAAALQRRLLEETGPP